MEISIFKAPMWAPRSQAIAYGCTANMICLPIQALEFLQGPAQTPPSPGHLPQQSSQNYLPPVLTNSLIYAYLLSRYGHNAKPMAGLS